MTEKLSPPTVQITYKRGQQDMLRAQIKEMILDNNKATGIAARLLHEVMVQDSNLDMAPADMFVFDITPDAVLYEEIR